MTRTFVFAVISTLLSSVITAQQPDDPFNWTEPIVIPSNIYVLSSGGAYPDSLNPSLDVYFSSNAGSTVESLRNDSLNSPVGGNKKMDLAVFNLDNLGTEELFGVWEGKDSSVVLCNLSPNNKKIYQVGGKLIQGNGEQSRIFIAPGDFDGDQLDEFVVAFVDINKTINLKLYDSDGTLTPALKASINDENLSGNSLNKIRFSIITGDFDHNGDDEIALLSYDADNDPGFEKGVYVKIYDVNGNYIIPKAKSVIMSETMITQSKFSLNEIVLAACTVPGYGSQADMIAIAFTTIHNATPNDDDTFLQLVKTSSDLNSLVSDENKRLSDYNNPNYLPSISLASGDINNNGSAELIFFQSGFFDMYRTDSELSLIRETGGGVTVSNGGDDLHDSYDYTEICHVDDLPGQELVVVKNIYSDDWENPFPQGFSVSVFGTTSDTLSSFSLKAYSSELSEVPYEWPNRMYAIAVADEEESKVTIQAPRYYHRTGISQPIVILNAPPVHFDIFDGVVYDVNTCYSDESCDFISKYAIVKDSTKELTTEIKSSWDVSAGFARESSISVGAEVEAAPLGVGGSVSAGYTENYEYHLLGEFGANFEETESKVQKQIISYEQSAIEDDQIFATITDYHIWEYPYFIGNNTEEAGVIVAFRPENSEARWFPSKSVSGYSYRPTHEVGNILSYYSYDEVNKNPNIFQEIQPLHDISTPTLTFSANSLTSWSLTNQNFTDHQASSEIRFGVDAGFLGFGYKASFNQSNSYLYTYKTSIAEELTLSFSIGGIDRSIGPTEYRITPYAYWSNEGALVFDYSVEPEIDLEGVPTWWQEMYGNNPDPTMILPWRLDPEKGFAVTDESKRQQTKDISLRPSFISPGDTAKITANVRNFSLVNTPGNVKVRFYLGDPTDGGQLVYDIYGNSEFETDGLVPARGIKTVEIIWVRPESSPSSRLYMVIDPDDLIDEVHENNNVGWISVLTSPATPVEDIPQSDNNGLVLHQNYPNPFTDKCAISYSISETENITLRIFDLSGKLVKSYKEGRREPGLHTIEIDASLFEPGVYIYTLQTSSQSVSNKMSIL